MIKNNNNELFIVPTPIGNFADITLRAITVLTQVDFIICEDTRVTNKLLSHLGIKKRMLCHHDYDSESQLDYLVEQIKQVGTVALVSDAGTALISDPGYKLIKRLDNENIKITALPGACSIITALVTSRLPTDRFTFIGFLPNKTSARKTVLSELKHYQSTLVFFESARRVRASLEDMLAVFGNREASVVRELTKIYEEVRHSKLTELIDSYKNQPEIKGEVIILLGKDSRETRSDNIDDLAQIILELIAQGQSSKDITNELLNVHPEFSKKEIYNLVIRLKGKK